MYSGRVIATLTGQNNIHLLQCVQVVGGVEALPAGSGAEHRPIAARIGCGEKNRVRTDQNPALPAYGPSRPEPSHASPTDQANFFHNTIFCLIGF
jgi:hypothetical protein